jgi:peptidoglycan/xylan/chitin deacetylase (PgdA/CDA1 family)
MENPMHRRVLASTALVWLFSCTPAAETNEVVPGWRWSDEEVMEAVNAVRAGRDLNPDSWPGGARVAVLLSFDVDNETIAVRFGEPTIGALSQGEYGARVALRRVVNLLDENEIPASFFIPAMSLVFNPNQVGIIQESGRHEFAVHGWIHELNSSIVDAEEERALLTRAIDHLEEVTGVRPVGYRAPSWNFSPNTLGILRDMGFMYESSLMADDRPYELLDRGEPTGIVELPVDWILDDAPLLNPLGNSYSPPREVLQVFIDEFDKAYEEGTMFLLTMHPHVSGHRSRIIILEELIKHINSRGNDVWYGTHRQAAEWVKEKAGM